MLRLSNVFLEILSEIIFLWISKPFSIEENFMFITVDDNEMAAKKEFL